MQAVIKVENVTKKFGDTTVLNGISLSFEKHKIHGLIGRNGSGKTMLLKCICGFVIPTTGTIHVNDRQIGKAEMYLKMLESLLKHLVFYQIMMDIRI